MTDQPIDHRAEAQTYLYAADETRPVDGGYGGVVEQHLDAITCALIAIANALLAGLLEPVEREYIPAATHSGTCPRCGRNDHPESAHDEAAARIAERVPVQDPGVTT